MTRTRIGRVLRELVDAEGQRWAVMAPLDQPRRVDPLREEREAEALVASISSDDELREWRSARLRWAMACPRS